MDSDKRNEMVNYASYINGATIVTEGTSLTTHAFSPSKGKIGNSVYELLTEQVNYGNCWGFDGNYGFATIELSEEIKV